MAEPPPALATTKRKFHRLLDNLTASTSTASLTASSPSSSLYSPAANASTGSLPRPVSPEPVAKRPRSSENASTTASLQSSSAAERQRQVSAGQARIQALKDQLLSPKIARKPTMRVVGPAQPTSPTPRKPPNFQPYSQDLFLERLKTFADVKKWTNKPDGIGEVEWAKRGWSCDTWNTVACKGGCEQRVAVKLRPKRKAADGRELDLTEDVSSEVSPDLVERYQALLIDGHADDCLWRKAACQDDIYHIPIASRARSTADLLTRYSFLLAISADLPLAKNIVHPGPPISSILARLSPTLFTNASLSPPSNQVEQTAFAFALFGWTGVSESRISLAVCNHCFQRLGLWMTSDARLLEMSKKLEVSVESLRLNLLESHREHCPWKNALVQGNSADGPIANMAAWETLVFMLVGKARPQTHSNTKDLPRLPNEAGHERVESVDLGSEGTYPRGSIDSTREVAGYNDEGDEETLTNKWKKFKAKLKRSTSKRSLKSVKSAKSVKSVKSSKSVASGKSGKENDDAE